MNALDKMSGHLTIDGLDAWEDLGFITLNGSMEDWLLLPERKDPFTHDWKDEDGLEVDLSHVYLKEKKTSLKVYFIADSESAFRTNYNATLGLLTAPGLRTIYYRAMDRSFAAYYTKSTNPTRVKGLSGDQVIVGMTLHFVLPNPSAN